jgi:hypothetical protein
MITPSLHLQQICSKISPIGCNLDPKLLIFLDSVSIPFLKTAESSDVSTARVFLDRYWQLIPALVLSYRSTTRKRQF